MEEKKRLRHFLLVLVCTVSAVVIVCFLVAQVSRVQSSSEDGEIANASLSDLLKDVGYLNENPDLCRNRPVENRVLLVCLSRVRAFGRRIAIRMTWGSPNQSHPDSDNSDPGFANYTLVFMVGQPRSRAESLRLQRETYLYGDVVVQDIEDSYNLLTVMVLKAFSWANHNCPDLKFLVKSDDDTFIQLRAFERKIRLRFPHQNISEIARKGVYGGYFREKTSVLREGKSRKWVVPHSEYPFFQWPGYCFGPMYFLSGPLVHKVVSRCHSHCVSPPKSYIVPPNGKNNLSCFWRFEDVFMGSCVNWVDPDRKLVSYKRETDYIFLFSHVIEYTLYPDAVMAHPVHPDDAFLQIHNVLSPTEISLQKLRTDHDQQKIIVEKPNPERAVEV